MKIQVFYDEVKFRLRKATSIKKFLEKVIRNENKIPGDLNFVFTGDQQLREINKVYLGHDYFTDVISFDNNAGNNLNGEIYISIERVKENARNYNVKLSEEVLRVMVHGILHLCGYRDDETKKKEEMFLKQEKLIIDFMQE